MVIEVDDLPDGLLIHKCDFIGCEFVTINHLDDLHVYCCIGEPVHFNMLHPRWRMGRCLQCKRVHVEYANGAKSSYMIDGFGEIIESTHISYKADPDFVPNWAKARLHR